MFKKPVWDDLSFVMLHYPAGSSIRRWDTVVIKWWTRSAINSGRLWCFKHAQLVLRVQSVPRKYPHTITPPAWTIETRQDGSMLSCSSRQILTPPLFLHNLHKFPISITQYKLSASTSFVIDGANNITFFSNSNPTVYSFYLFYFIKPLYFWHVCFNCFFVIIGWRVVAAYVLTITVRKYL